MASSSTAKRLIEKSRKLADQRQQNLIDQIGRFSRLDVAEWTAKVGPAATTFDTGHQDDHGAEGSLVIVGENGSGLIVDYVWDDMVKLKRWLGVRVIDREAGDE